MARDAVINCARAMHRAIINALALTHATVEGFIISATVNMALGACSTQYAAGDAANGSTRADVAGMALACHGTNNAAQNCTANDASDNGPRIALTIGHAAGVIVTIGAAAIALGISRRNGQHQAGQTANDDQ